MAIAGLDSKQTHVPARTFLYLAPVGTEAPPDATTAMAAAWLNVGHTTPDSTKFTTEPEFEQEESAQSDHPIRRFQTKDNGALEVALKQWNAINFKSVYGGGTVSKIGTTNQYKFVPPRLGERTEVAAVLETIDVHRYRFVFPRVFQVEGVELELFKGKGSNLPLKMGLLGGDGVDPWYMLTDDPSFAPTP